MPASEYGREMAPTTNISELIDNGKLNRALLSHHRHLAVASALSPGKPLD